MKEITGKLAHTIFANDSNGYAVISFKLDTLNEKHIIATGILSSLSKEFKYSLQGEYIEHPKYGMQFKVSSYARCMPDDNDGIIKYLSGPQFAGIGKKIAKDIVDTLGIDCIDKIKNDYDILDQVASINAKKKQAIVNGFENMDDIMEKTIQFFSIHGLSQRNIMRLNMTYGKDAIAKVSENPYRLVYECDGIGFKTCDKLASYLGFDMQDERRLEALLVSLCMQICMNTKDTYVMLDVLKEKFIKETNSNDFDNVLQKSLLDYHLVQEEDRIYHVSQYKAETKVASFLESFPYYQLDPYDKTIYNVTLDKLQQEITYNDKQLEAIHTFFRNDLMIITGGPGTGKTTIVKALCEMFKKLYPSNSLVCIAPTGRASKRMSMICDVKASTIHSLLAWNLETNTFGKNEKEPLDVDVLIIDEFSMVDNWLFYNLLAASINVKKICIIGDENQLPSVSCGALLHDLINADICPVIRLDHIYRQQIGSDIINLAYDIINNNVDFQNYHNGLLFVECNKFQVKDIVVNIVNKAIDKGYDLNDIQVLSSMYKGLSGIDNLNNALQNAYNPYDINKKEIRYGYQIFREHDKILQLKNQIDDDVYNGDIGIIEEIVLPDEIDGQYHIIANFDGIFVEYTNDNIENITHAYCISIHKSQGNEYPIVIVPVFKEHMIMMHKKLIYTAITRAKSSLIIIGEKEVFNKAVTTNDRHIRQTTLISRFNK